MAEQKTMLEEVGNIFTQLQNTNSTSQVSTTPDPNIQITPVVSAVATPDVAPVAATVPDVIVPTVAPVVDANAFVDVWDTDPSTVSTPVATAPVAQAPVATPQDFSYLADVLGKEKITSKEELLSAVNEVKSKAEVVTGLPENLTKALEIAKQGGNYLEYLGVSVVDWSKEDPITLYENYVIDQYTRQDGTVDYEKVDKILDKIDEDDKEMRGMDLQKQYINYQAQQKNALEQQARNSRMNFEQTIRKTLDGVSEIAGFKLSPTHKEDIYAYIAKGEDLRNQDINQRIHNAFITKYWGKIDGYRKTQIKNSALKNILEQVTVSDITPVNSAPLTSDAPKGYSIDDYIKGLETRKF